MKTCEVKNPITLAVNIPADGLFPAILKTQTETFPKKTVHEYRHYTSQHCGKMDKL